MSRPAACEACGAPLVWAESSTSGKPSPIVLEPNPEKGNVLVYRSTEGERGLVAVALPADVAADLRGRGVPLRLNHFADCPDRERFRR